MPSQSLDLGQSVPDCLIEHPYLLRPLERLGIDYSCGGKSLEVAAREAGMDPATVLQELQAAIDSVQRVQ